LREPANAGPSLREPTPPLPGLQTPRAGAGACGPAASARGGGVAQAQPQPQPPVEEPRAGAAACGPAARGAEAATPDFLVGRFELNNCNSRRRQRELLLNSQRRLLDSAMVPDLFVRR
ncbi:unnamed protein product, partial [Urochloa humidicola]